MGASTEPPGEVEGATDAVPGPHVRLAPGETGALTRRVRTSLLFVPVLVGIAWPGGWVFAVFVSLVSVLGVLELSGMAARVERPLLRPLAVPLAAAVPVLLHVYGIPRTTGWIPSALVLLAFVLRRRRGPVGALAVTVLALAYVPFLLGHLVLLRDGLATGGRQGLAAVLFLFAITWACDTFAYVVGRALGRRPLWPQVSPNKTVEGALGGTVAALLAALGVRALGFTAISPAAALALGLVLAVTLQLGDLFESHLKRRAGVKDSSAMLPGHGGVLDRFDSMLFGAPVLFHVLRLL